MTNDEARNIMAAALRPSDLADLTDRSGGVAEAVERSQRRDVAAAERLLGKLFAAGRGAAAVKVLTALERSGPVAMADARREADEAHRDMVRCLADAHRPAA